MRSIISFIFFLICATVIAQTEVISSGPIPIGIKIYDYENERPLDISTLCDGFDEDGLPINLVMPNNSQILLFLPTINESNAGDYLISKSGKQPRPITNFNYEHEGRKVAFLGNTSYSGRQRGSISVNQISKNGYVVALGKRLNFEWIADKAPFFLTLFLENEEIDEREEYIDSVMNNLFSPTKMEPKSYDYWIEKGFASEVDEEGRPIFPVLPQGVGTLSFLTDAPLISVTRNGEYFDFMRVERGYRDERNYYLSTDKPGTYVITASDPEQKYGRSTFVYTYTISYSFWKQGGYYLLAAIAALAIAFLFYRVNAQRKLESSQLQKQVSDAELKAVRAQLNPHFLFNALNAIQNLVNQNATDKANDYIVKLSKLLRTVLAQSDEALHSLENEINLSSLYLELEHMRRPFDFNVEVDPSVDMNALVPNMILQPYLENAVIHGIQKNKASHVTLNAKQQNGQLVLTVSDNGKPESTSFQEGKGMALGRNRLDIIRKQVGDSVKAGIKACSSSENGFIVEIRLPADL